MADKSPLRTVGRIGSVFGVSGWVKIQSFTSPPEKLLEYQPWLIKTQHGVKEIEVIDSKIQSNGIIVLFAGYEDREIAKTLATLEIAVDDSVFPLLSEGEYYWHQLQGLSVVTVYENKERCLGQVTKMMETGSNDVFVVKGGATGTKGRASIDNRERLIPYIDHVIKSVDLQNKQVTVDWDPDF